MIPKNKIQRYKQTIRSLCKLCEGEGCSECSKKSIRIDNYATANIPLNYWKLSWKEFAGDPNFKTVIAEKLGDIEGVYDRGESFMFTGIYGTGKTYAACCIVKMAVAHKFSAQYIAMQDVVNRILSKKLDTFSVLKEFTEIDFLVIDEFDPRWIFPSENVEQIFGSALEHILRTRWQNGLPTIMCSNMADVDNILGGRFARAFKSLRNEFLQVIPVGGKDFRRSGE